MKNFLLIQIYMYMNVFAATSNEEVDFDHKRQKSPKSDRTRSVTTDQGYQERVLENGDHSRHTTTTTVITGEQVHAGTDVSIPEGTIRGEVLDLAKKNRSFVLDFETCEKQSRRLLPDGSIDTTIKQRVKVNHFDEAEVDGIEDLCEILFLWK